MHPTSRGKPRPIHLRRDAEGRDCQIRLPSICNGDPATVVLCHLPGAGMGRKHHDLHGAWGCSDCHAVVDGRVRSDIPADLLRLWLLEAVIRTQEILVAEGRICARN